MADDTDVSDAVPNTPPPHIPEHHDALPQDPRQEDDLRATVAALQDKVTDLETTVNGLIPEPETHHDEKPRSLPWTHRHFGGS